LIAFERPTLLILALLLPLLWAGRRFFARSGIRFPLGPSGGQVLGPLPLLPRLLKTAGTALFLLGLFACIVAAAGPARVNRRVLYLSRGNEILFVLDVSPSMAAGDFQPTRLDSAKAIIDGFLKERRNESIGLVAFGAEAALICPPTLDYRSLSKRLAELKPGLFGDGTALGAGIATALAHSGNSGAPERSVVILTDGENNAGAMSPSTAVALAARRGVAVSIIGVGSRGDVPLSYVDPATGQKRTGSYHSEFDRTALETLAKAGGGRYYAAENGEALHAAFAAISDSSTSLARTRSVSTEESLMRPLLGLALLLLALSRLLELIAGGDFL
jgi:Ca-activated chloride channel family protein